MNAPGLENLEKYAVAKEIRRIRHDAMNYGIGSHEDFLFEMSEVARLFWDKESAAATSAGGFDEYVKFAKEFLQKNITVYDQRIAALSEALSGYSTFSYHNVHMRPQQEMQDELENLTKEKSTLQLLLHLHVADFETDTCRGIKGNFSAVEVARDRLCQPELARASRTIQWLEEEEEVGDINWGAGQRVEYRKTLQHLNSDGRSLSVDAVVSHLDPDSTSREKKRLFPQDAAQDEALLRQCFRLLRAGQEALALRLCEHYGQPWRAASISGGKLWHDHQDQDARRGANGNRRRHLWKSACLQLAASPSVWEKGVYSLLAGQADQLLSEPVLCRSYHDCLWVLLKARLTQHLDDQIQEGFFPNPAAAAGGGGGGG
eukprot:CAMPEP_0175139008 /NCGR_PEP_ID=MMETSP0087-20121206/10661_1 /TAXON_ID=136419 /ORGANISM="Unknown Unknown, Strain D1" /LENGTH=373 /DNA_ID=CAMNT_0016421965 /DNA_START=57 /DNA_END=1174 /DNA_ORIENTATION=+